MSHTPPGWYSEEDGRHEYWDGGQSDERMTASRLAVETDEFEQSAHSVVAACGHTALSNEPNALAPDRVEKPVGAVTRLWQHVTGAYRSS